MIRILAVAATLCAGPVMARTFENCGVSDRKIADAAIGESLAVVLHAAAAVGDTDDYATWFGRHSASNGEEVRGALKAIHAALKEDDVTAVCLGSSDIDCKQGTYAFVLFDRPRAMHLCPSFFDMPTMRDAVAGVADLENGTREGTIVHEMSHFPAIAGTEDHCYSRSACSELAGRDPRSAIDNADSYQYFAEDAMMTWLAKGG